MDEILQDIRYFVANKISKSINKSFILTSDCIRYNLNNTNIRYSAKVEQVIIDEIKKHFTIVNIEVQTLINAKIKKNYAYSIVKK